MKRALGMAEPLLKNGWHVSIIALDCEENKKRVEIEAPNVAVYYFREGGTFSEIKQKATILKQIRPDVVWVCALVARNFIFKRRYKVFVEHSELSSAIPDNKGVEKIFTKFLESFSIQYDGLICASRYLQNYYNKKTNKPILYSPYAYTEKVVNMPVDKILEDLQQLNKGRFVFVYMGTLTRNYGLFTMLEAAKILADEHINFTLYLLGRGRDYENAKNFVQTNNLGDYIVISGYIEEEYLNTYFTLANVFISPLNDTIQDWARCPSKIYMFLPYRKPILTCKIGEPHEIFKENGCYFDNNSPASLANLMKTAMDNNCSFQIINALDHSWTLRAKSFIQWYKENF
ncbi:MAG: glycosyltransferase [Bacteroidales bacterium]|nr:glycosyltransferase [Bacteroidales bacterium]